MAKAKKKTATTKAATPFNADRTVSQTSTADPDFRAFCSYSAIYDQLCFLQTLYDVKNPAHKGATDALQQHKHYVQYQMQLLAKVLFTQQTQDNDGKQESIHASSI